MPSFLPRRCILEVTGGSRCHSSAFTTLKLELVIRYHFHFFDGEKYQWDAEAFYYLILQPSSLKRN